MRALPLAFLLTVACSSSPPVTPCASGKSACGANCVSTLIDDANCGTCGKACGATEGCGNGACFPKSCGAQQCGPDEVCSSDGCVSKACVGVICGAGFACSQGVCACATGHAACGGACADLQIDSANCGTCGHACPADQACAGGGCLSSDCPGQACDGLSVCFNGHCEERACVGVVCPGGQTCSGGGCGCPSGGIQCNGVCTGTATDSANCGACGHACGSNEACGGGACLPTTCDGGSCDALSVCVQNACVTQSCVGVPCAPGKHCSDGVCFCDDLAVADCGNTCADLMSDGLNCGVCGNACVAGTSCVGGACLSTGCTGGKRVCSGACVDLQTDPDNCNACGNACGGGRVCVAGQCQCPSGLLFCGASCANLQTDGLNCGACGKSCNGGTCAAALCQCPASQTICSGTCRATGSDPMNCGSCGHACGATQTCVNNTCVCGPGTTACGGSCINTASDNLNCGGCGTTCPPNAVCANSVCTTMFTCQSSFTAAPADCPAFPLTAAACGQSSLTNSTAWMGALPQSPTQALARIPGEEIRVIGSATGGGFGATLAFHNSSMGQIAALGQGCCCNTCTVNFDFRITGSAWACASPVDVTESAVASTYAYNIEHWTFSGKYNTGGTAPGAPTDLVKDATSGRICDQVCGDVKLSCGDNAQYYRLLLPAHKAAVVQSTFGTRSGGTAFDLTALDLAGAQICGLISNTSVGTTPSSFKNRLVNNTDIDQAVLLVPTARNGNLVWNMSVAVEP